MALTMDRETANRIRAEAKRFMEDYYRMFDAIRTDLVNLYREESVLNFEGREMIKGKEAIVAKLTSLQQFRYQISHIDCVPFVPTSGAIAQVMGDMWLDGKQDCPLFRPVVPFGPNTTRKLLCKTRKLVDRRSE